MGLFRVAVAGLGLAMMGAGLPAQTTEPVKTESARTRLTWEACVRLATANNPDLQAAREGVLNSDAVRLGAYSTLFPQITASFSDGRSYSGPGLGAPSNYSTSYAAQLSLTQRIFDGFSTQANIASGKAQLALAFAELNSEKASVSFDLKSAFAQLLYAQQLIDLSENVIAIRKNTAHLVKDLYEGGREDRGAMLLSNANFDQANNDLDTANRTFDLSGLQLAVAIGQNLAVPIEAVGELVTSSVPTKPDYRKLAVTTPAYFERRAQVDAAAAGITQAASGFYPTLSAGASVSRHASDFPPEQNGWSVGLNASYPIFEGGATYFNVKAANASFRQALAGLHSGTDQAALTLAQTFKTLADTQSNVRIQDELLTATALRYKIAEAQYKNGLESFQDFNSITDSYVSQQKVCLAAHRDAVIAEANWEQVRGLGAIP